MTAGGALRAQCGLRCGVRLEGWGLQEGKEGPWVKVPSVVWEGSLPIGLRPRTILPCTWHLRTSLTEPLHRLPNWPLALQLDLLWAPPPRTQGLRTCFWGLVWALGLPTANKHCPSSASELLGDPFSVFP